MKHLERTIEPRNAFGDPNQGRRLLDQPVSRRTFLGQTLSIGAVAGLTPALLGALIEACSPSPGPTSGTLKRGGTLTAGITANGVDTIDPHKPATWMSDARVQQLHDLLVYYDENYVLRNGLADELKAESADTWVIRIKQGVTFHDGKTMTIDDVIYSIRRMVDPATAAGSAAALGSVDPNGIQKLDNYTARLKLLRPDVTIGDALAQWTSGIVPVGYDPTKPVGTGPFKLQSYTPNEQSVMIRNPNYWQQGLPYVDKLILIDFQDDTARLNGLLSGQLDVIDHVPYDQIKLVQARSDLQIIQSKGNGQFVNFCMRVDTPPFDDNNVRMAMRLIADRPQLVANSINGYGRIGNDVSSPVDPAYDQSLPQRQQDLAQAKSLLKKAGHDNLTITLVTSEVSAGATAAAQIFAQQALGAGVTVTLNKVPGSVLYGPNWLKWSFTQDFWGTHSYLSQVSLGLLPTSPYNETHWPDAESRSKYLSLYTQALGTVDDQARYQILHQMQRLDYDRGGNIIWGFEDVIDAASAKVHGIAPTKSSLPLDFFGFKHAWKE